MIRRLLLAALCSLVLLGTAEAQTRLGPLGPGLACNPLVYNPGTAPVTADCTITPQLFYEGHATSCTINSTCGSVNDSGKLLTATTTGVTFTTPGPGAAGGAGYSFGIDATGDAYSIHTPSGTIYGCGPAGSTVSLSTQASITPDGTNWMCTPLGGTSGGGGAPTGNCSQSTAFFLRVNNAGATLTTSTHNAVDTAICGLVTDGVWALLDALWVPAIDVATGTLATIANMNWVSSSYTLTVHGTPTLTVDAGYTGVDASSTIYIDTGFNPSTAGGHYALNSEHLSFWSLNATQSSATGGTAMGIYDGTNISQVIPYYSSNTAQCQLSEPVAGSLAFSIGTALGHTLCTRNSVNSEFLFRNGASLASGSTSSVSLINLNFFILARNSSGAASTGAGNQIAVATIGGALTFAQVSSLGSTPVTGSNASTATGLTPRMCTYLVAVHGSC
jgi:hypothetical protein